MKNFLSIALALMLVLTLVGSSAISAEVNAPSDFIIAGNTLYAYCGQYEAYNAYYAVNTLDPSDAAPAAEPYSFTISTACLVGDTVYAYSSDCNFYAIDAETFSATLIGEVEWDARPEMDMAYDHTTDTVYGVYMKQFGDTGWDYTTCLCTVDLSDGSITDVGFCTGSNEIVFDTERVAAITVDKNGELYMIGTEGGFYSVNKATGETTLIADFGIPAPAVQSMACDFETNTIFWAQTSFEGNSLYAIDIPTAEIMDLGPIFEGGQYYGLFFKNEEPSGLPDGDVNGNGIVEVSDAVLALRNAIGLLELTPDQIDRADLDKDGIVQVADAVNIVRLAIGTN